MNIFFQFLFSILLHQVTHVAVSSPEDVLNDWQIRQQEVLGNRLENWVADFCSQFESKIVQLEPTSETNACTKLGIGLAEIFNKIYKEVNLFRRTLRASTHTRTLDLTSSYLENTDHFLQRLKFISEESFSEKSIPCITKFQKDVEYLNNQLYPIRSALLADIKQFKAIAVAQSITQQRLDAIVEVEQMANLELATVVDNLLNNLNDFRIFETNFSQLRWLLANIGPRAPTATKLIIVLAFNKLRYSSFRPGYLTELAYYAHLNNIPLEGIRNFPPQLKYLFSKPGKAIFNVKAGRALQEEYSPNANETEVPLTLESQRVNNYTEHEWKIQLPNDVKYHPFFFRLQRNIIGADKDWFLQINGSNAVFLEAEMSTTTFWEIYPVWYNTRTDVIFTLAPYTPGKPIVYLCVPVTNGTEEIRLETEIQDAWKEKCYWQLHNL